MRTYQEASRTHTGTRAWLANNAASGDGRAGDIVSRINGALAGAPLQIDMTLAASDKRIAELDLALHWMSQFVPRGEVTDADVEEATRRLSLLPEFQKDQS